MGSANTSRLMAEILSAPTGGIGSSDNYMIVYPVLARLARLSSRIGCKPHKRLPKVSQNGFWPVSGILLYHKRSC